MVDEYQEQIDRGKQNVVDQPFDRAVDALYVSSETSNELNF